MLCIERRLRISAWCILLLMVIIMVNGGTAHK